MDNTEWNVAQGPGAAGLPAFRAIAGCVAGASLARRTRLHLRLLPSFSFFVFYTTSSFHQIFQGMRPFSTITSSKLYQSG